MWPWYIFAKNNPEMSKRCNMLMRTMLGLVIQNEKYGDIVYCTCMPDKRKNVSHVLFECLLLNDLRDSLWSLVCSVAPPALVEGMVGMHVDVRTKFIFTGFQSKYMMEFDETYIVLLKCVCCMLNKC